MDRAEAPLAEGGGARGHGDEEEAPRLPGGGVEGTRQAPCQLDGQPRLAMALEGQQALGQLGPVRPGRHDGKQDGAVHVHQGRRLGLGPERPQRQQAELPRARSAERSVLGTAADAVHGHGKGQHLGRGCRRPVGQPCQRPRVAATVSRCRRCGRGKVRICGQPPRVGVFHPPILDRGVRRRKRRRRLCGQRIVRAAPLMRGTPPARVGTAPCRPRAQGPAQAGTAVARLLAAARSAGQPGKDGSMGPLSCGDQPLPSRWKIPSADWP